MTSKDLMFVFSKQPDSLNLRFEEARQDKTPIAVEHDKISHAVTDIFTKLIEKNPSRYQKLIPSLSRFSIIFIQPNSGQGHLTIKSDDVEIHLNKVSEQTAALFLNSVKKSSWDWVVGAAAYLVSRLVEAVTYVLSSRRHFTKWTKYRLIQEQLGHFANLKDVKKLENHDSGINGEITAAWNFLVEALLEPTHFETPDDQYRKTVICLRKTRKLIISSESTKEKFASQLQFIKELSYMRFAGIELFPYCQQLVEYASGKPLPSNLTLGTFQKEFKHFTTILKDPAKSTTMNPFARNKNKAKGFFNIGYDPLLKTSNIPYRDGQITVNGRSTLMLWHGTPVEHHDPFGSLYDMAAGVLKYIPFVGGWIAESNPVTNSPAINADYPAFIEAAEQKGENILHVILEDGKKRYLGDESNRVKARIGLAADHQNFFPIALRLDGDFFERHDTPKTHDEPIESLKNRLKNQLLMPFVNVEENQQMEEQLAANGFYIPQKLRDACKLNEKIDTLLNEVQKIYFSGTENITTQEQHQAFLILSYVHIILFVCWKMDISILEALCKDDKDRGNVIKTILKLHFLYITGQANHENLTSVLTHVLARPFILQKAPIIKSRKVLIERVIPFISAAHEKVPVPITEVFGRPVENASYAVDKPHGQTIYPNNATTKTIEEYQAFLQNHRPRLAPPCTESSIQRLARQLYLNGHRQDAAIQQKISDAAREKLLTHLNGIFANRALKISVKPTELTPSIRITKENNTAGLRYDACFSITDGTASYGIINASMTIKDLTKRQAQFEYSLA